jgi:hypothetical protein
MMVQTGLALSHGQGTKHHLPIHHLSSNNNVLSRPLGPQQPNLPSVHHSPAKSPPDAPSSAEIPSEVLVSLPLVQTTHEKEETEEV